MSTKQRAPQREVKEVVTARLSPELITRARSVAAREQLTFTELITQGLEAQLAELEAAAAPKRGKRT